MTETPPVWFARTDMLERGLDAWVRDMCRTPDAVAAEIDTMSDAQLRPYLFVAMQRLDAYHEFAEHVQKTLADARAGTHTPDAALAELDGWLEWDAPHLLTPDSPAALDGTPTKTGQP